MRRVAALSLALLLLSGCSEGKNPLVPVVYGPPLPTNDTPRGAVLRFVASYELKRVSDYADMVTGDFTFEFSNGTDPDLVTKYSTGWFKSDEAAASAHLFQGYTPQGEPFAPAASSINLDFENTAPVDDNSFGTDPVTHKVLPTRIDGQIVIPPTPPSTDPTTYRIENNYNAFYLVRGDQAVGLTASQPADSVHWYIYRWVDLTVASTSARSPQAASAATWGKVKGLYR